MAKEEERYVTIFQQNGEYLLPASFADFQKHFIRLLELGFRLPRSVIEYAIETSLIFTPEPQDIMSSSICRLNYFQSIGSMSVELSPLKGLFILLFETDRCSFPDTIQTDLKEFDEKEVKAWSSTIAYITHVMKVYFVKDIV